ncbi:MAG: diguanylate cyclase [Hyphomicrobiaceae bacterium]|nr:diguanylate cyclase [Hyphomicrobiaceae bacterium]
MRDVDPNCQIEALQARVQQLEAVVHNFPGGLMLLDEELNVVLCNDQQKRLLDYPDFLFARERLSLEDLFRFNAQRGEYGPGDVEEHVRVRLERARTALPHVVERTRPNGTTVEIRGTPLPKGGFVVTYLDVTERRRQQALISHLAHHDPLTNLPNRVLLLDRLGQALARVRRGDVLALHYLDLDRFKPINDTHGHAVGDALLVEIAQRFRDATREVDTVARIGGDEFVVLQSGIREASDVETLARRLLRTIARRHVVRDLRLEIGLSIGIALAPEDGLDPDELLRKADEALYACKGKGGDGFELFGRRSAQRRTLVGAD